MLHVDFGVFAKTHEDGDIVREPLDLSMPAGLLHVVGKLDTPIALEGSPVGGDGLVFEVDGKGFVIGFGCNRFSNEPGGNGIGIAVKGGWRNPGELWPLRYPDSRGAGPEGASGTPA